VYQAGLGLGTPESLVPASHQIPTGKALPNLLTLWQEWWMAHLPRGMEWLSLAWTQVHFELG
jgi:hypothetical protein